MRKKWLIHIALALILPGASLQAQSNDLSVNHKNADALTITITKLDVRNKILKLSYEIRNETKHDTWILMGIGKSGSFAEVYMDNDGRTLVIRRRFDVPFSGGDGQIYGRYVRMRPRQRKTETISLAMPVYPVRGFSMGQRKAQGLEHATRLAIEIGFYSGNLPGMIHSLIEELEKIKFEDKLYILKVHFGQGLLGFNELNEELRHRDEEIYIPYTYQVLKGEQFLSTTIDGLLIPYYEKDFSNRSYPDLSSSTRVEIHYKPSMLEYFFPYPGQQNLLNEIEKKSLKNNETYVINDQDRIGAFARDISSGTYIDEIACERVSANVICYNDDELLGSFTIYDESIGSKGRCNLTYSKGLQSLRILTPQIKPLELRVQCSNNLKNLWHRYGLYYKTEKNLSKESIIKSGKIYPKPNVWCDAMLHGAYYKMRYYVEAEDIVHPLSCPSADEGKCHYAMNPKCRPDSPGDMVLLFETRAGWNQHGGPELFTFDNHDPRGGCVLFNDGTVKFIHTEEELKNLRWK